MRFISQLGQKLHIQILKYFTTAEYNKFASQTLDAKILLKGLVDKSAIAGFINNADSDKKSSNISNKAELKAEQDKITKLETFDSNYFRIKSYFEGDGTQNYLVFCSDPTPRNSLFGAAKLVKNVNIGKYKYSGYGIGFDTKGIFIFRIYEFFSTC